MLVSSKFPKKWKSQRRKRKNRGKKRPNGCVRHPFLLPPPRCLYTEAPRALILLLEPWGSHDIPSCCWLVSIVPSVYLRGSRNLCAEIWLMVTVSSFWEHLLNSRPSQTGRVAPRSSALGDWKVESPSVLSSRTCLASSLCWVWHLEALPWLMLDFPI